jgi:hypothetical protein
MRVCLSQKIDRKWVWVYNTVIVQHKPEFTMTVKRFKQSQRFRICMVNASFYATAKQIRNGVGDFSTCNAATQKALDALEFTRSGSGVADQCAVGIAGTWEGLQVQINVA